MNELTREISSATAQQHAASDQAVRALQEVNSISRQAADGSHEVKNTTVDLHRLSDELLQTLAV